MYKRFRQLRLALVAPSGSGKSTVAHMLKTAFERKGLDVEVLKLAHPLYRLQAKYYEEAGLKISGKAQDQLLLQSIASNLRALDPKSLVNNFNVRLGSCHASVVINDDLRDDRVDYPFLRELEFSTIKIVVDPKLREQRLALRGDVKLSAAETLNEQMRRIPGDLVLTNNGDLDVLSVQIEAAAECLIKAAPNLAPGR